MTTRPADAPPGWEGLLAEGENILWQGRPEPGLTLRPVLWPQIGIGRVVRS